MNQNVFLTEIPHNMPSRASFIALLVLAGLAIFGFVILVDFLAMVAKVLFFVFLLIVIYRLFFRRKK